MTAGGVFSGRRVDAGTKLLIESLQVGEADRVLDLGCGYGPVGIVAAHLAPRGHVVLVDINERAVRLARENLVLNAVQNAEVRQGDGAEAVKELTFDTIACNPPIRAGWAVVERLLGEAGALLVPGGCIYVVARTKQGAKTLARKLEALVGPTEEVERGGGYRGYRAQRRTAGTPPSSMSPTTKEP